MAKDPITEFCGFLIHIFQEQCHPMGLLCVQQINSYNVLACFDSLPQIYSSVSVQICFSVQG